LTGVHLGSYGHDFGDKVGLKRLVQQILDETEIPRLRLSSLEPWDLADGFFTLWENPRLCPHLHLPLQSGCDATLRRMRRNTNQADFRAIVEAAHTHIPDLRLTSDVIVGFPGETDDEFNISEAFIHEMNFAGLHVFRYSIRQGTPAARMKGQVRNTIKKERSARLLAHAAQAEANFAAQFSGTVHSVLWEQVTGSTEEGFVNLGYTDNYLRVRCVHPRVLSNLITDAELGTYENDMLQAYPVLEYIG